MDSEAHQLHMFFFPFMAHGHMIPMLDMAILFAERGVKVSLITTTLNAEFMKKTIDQGKELGHQIQLYLLQIPYSESGLPHGSEVFDSIISKDMLANLFKAISMIQDPFEQLVGEHLPDCIVSDSFLPWTFDVTNKFHIPRLTFSGSSFFSLSISESLKRYTPHGKVASDKEAFLVPDLPHPIELKRSQLPDYIKSGKKFIHFIDQIRKADLNSFGFVMNSFNELETLYVDHFKNMGRKAWHIGPVSLRNRNTLDMSERGKKASINGRKCLSWLDSQEPNSVIYICFGSLCRFTDLQLAEIALALEACERPFIWVIRDANGEGSKNWMSNKMEEKLKDKSLIISGWAPQILILNHHAIGVFVTHCGWNSILEGVSAGVAMVTWPIFAEQFFNEKLVTEVLKIGVGVGSEVWIAFEEEDRPVIRSEEIEKAITRVVAGGEEAVGMRKRARELREMARKAMEEGGSSYVHLSTLIEELKNAVTKGKK
ncbi:scopoletin glucosyltransferase-like [Tasmannia lanceolata]|uniref:scopoletin glucosyltransferase-like n=1 Tax=Tasmannia lanceolata TaxID=3420 RepID=UPI004064C2C7